MKKSKLCGILVLTFLSSFLIFCMILPKASAQAQVNYGEYEYTNVSGTDVNVTILANVGILTDGGVSIWGLNFEVKTNASISSVIVRGADNGTTYQRGITFTTSADYKNDISLKEFPPFSKVFIGSFMENLLLIPGLSGIPNQFSFNVSIYIANTTNNQNLSVSSGDSPLITIILQDPESPQELGSLFFGLFYSLPFIMPITIFAVHLGFKKFENRKNSKNKNIKETGGKSSEA